MKSKLYGGILVLSIILVGFVLVAGCDGGYCEEGKCGTWFFTKSNGEYTKMTLNPNMTYSWEQVTCRYYPYSQQPVCNYPPTSFTSTYTVLGPNTIKISIPQIQGSPSPTELIWEFQPQIPRYVTRTDTYPFIFCLYNSIQIQQQWTDRYDNCIPQHNFPNTQHQSHNISIICYPRSKSRHAPALVQSSEATSTHQNLPP
jgi:hypothetical protein